MRFAPFFLATPLVCATIFGFTPRAEALVCQQCVSDICDASPVNGSCLYRFSSDGPSCYTGSAPMCVKRPNYYDDPWDDTWWRNGSQPPAYAEPFSGGQSDVRKTKGAVASFERLDSVTFRNWRTAMWLKISNESPDLLTGMLPHIRSYQAARDAVVDGDPKGITRTANVLYRTVDGKETEGLDPRLQVMPKWAVSANLLADASAVEPTLAWAIAKLASESLENVHGQIYSMCLDANVLKTRTPSFLHSRFLEEAKLTSLQRKALSQPLDPEQLKSMRATRREDVFYELEWTLPSGADLPTALTIKLRDSSAATNGVSGIRINFAYGKTLSQEPFAFAKSVDYLAK